MLYGIIVQISVCYAAYILCHLCAFLLSTFFLLTKDEHKVEHKTYLHDILP